MTITIPSGRTLPLVAKDGGGFRSEGRPISNVWVEGTPPAIQNVSGTFTAGQQATLTVDNLSQKRSGQLGFVRFAGETLGNSVTGISQDGTGEEYIATSGGYFDGAFARSDANQAELASAAIVLAQEYDEIFFEGWHRIQLVDYDSGGDEQVKLFRFVPGTSLGESAQNRKPTLKLERVGGNFLATVRPDVAEVSWYGAFPTENVWWPWTMYMKIGTANTADGKRYVKVANNSDFGSSSFPSGHLASPSGSVAISEWDGEDVVTNDGTLEGNIGRIFMPYFTRTDQHTISDLDWLYVNDSPERVVVGNASTWDACDRTKTFVLPQASRGNGSVTVDIPALGPLATGAAYLYVFNRDGEYNASGYLWRSA